MKIGGTVKEIICSADVTGGIIFSAFLDEKVRQQYSALQLIESYFQIIVHSFNKATAMALFPHL